MNIVTINNQKLGGVKKIGIREREKKEIDFNMKNSKLNDENLGI